MFAAGFALFWFLLACGTAKAQFGFTGSKFDLLDFDGSKHLLSVARYICRPVSTSLLLVVALVPALQF